jgi:hypothetical protein
MKVTLDSPHAFIHVLMSPMRFGKQLDKKLFLQDSSTHG